MQRRIFLLLLVVTSSLHAAPQTPPTPTRDATLAALTAELHRQSGVPGMAVAIARDGETLWRGEAGVVNIDLDEPVTSGSVFRLASVSKAICSAMAAKLIDEEVLTVDTRVGQLLPELPRQYHPLTLRDLFTHTSGLPHYQGRDSHRGSKRYADAVAGLEQLGDRDLVGAPGGEYLYSTHGFSLASAMMERASVKIFPELFATFVGSSGVRLESARDDAPDRSRIYQAGDGGDPRELTPEDFSYSWCGAGMESSAASLSRLASTLFGEASPLGEGGRALLREPLLNRHGDRVSTDRWDMTLGWRRSQDARGEIYLHHAGVTNGARSVLAVWPSTSVAAGILSNASWTGRMEDTAVALAIAATSESTKPCPHEGRVPYSGSFRDDPVAASITWSSSEDACSATLREDGPLYNWLQRFSRVDDSDYRLISLGDDYFGLATPIGISILSRTDDGLDGYVGSRRLSLNPSSSNP